MFLCEWFSMMILPAKAHTLEEKVLSVILRDGQLSEFSRIIAAFNLALQNNKAWLMGDINDDANDWCWSTSGLLY